jgi:hypothetical protein
VNSLASAISDNYRHHPAFDFGTHCLQLPEEILSKFNATFGAADGIGKSLDNDSFLALRHDCARYLDDAFVCLSGQVHDELEKQFLEELRSFSQDLMQQELTWFAKPMSPRCAHLHESRIQEYAISMQTHRYFFGRLPATAVDEIRAIGTADLERFRTNARAGQLTREDLSVNSGATVRAIRSILNREFQALGVLDAVSAYVGRKICVAGLALELSVPQSSWWKNAIPGLERSPKTVYAHLDEAITHPKSIVYLTDVKPDNGPTGCYPHAFEAMQLNRLQEIIGRVVGKVGSIPASALYRHYRKQYHQSTSSESFRRHLMLLPESIRFNSHLGWDVLPDSDLESRLVSSENTMTGPAGTFIAFDGARLLHRGGLIQSGERAALQVILSDDTTMQRVVNTVKRKLA